MGEVCAEVRRKQRGSTCLSLFPGKELEQVLVYRYSLML